MRAYREGKAKGGGADSSSPAPLLVIGPTTTAADIMNSDRFFNALIVNL